MAISLATVFTALLTFSGERAAAVKVQLTYTVDTTSDPSSGTDCSIMFHTPGACSLREAIAEANLHMFGTDTIVFDLKSSGTPTIDLTTPLPAITDPVTINGNTGGADRVELHGPGGGALGLTINSSAPGTTIDHLVIDNFSRGIQVNGNGFTLKGSFIGTNSAGTAAGSTSSSYGVVVEASGAFIGGTNGTDSRGSCTGDCNLISGISASVGIGLYMRGNNGSVEGNFIGTDVTGTYSIPNQIGTVPAGDTTMIGGHSSPAQGNVVSGNSGGQISVSGVAATIEGNFIGTNSAGTAVVSGSVGGINLTHGDGSVVGGAAIGAGNLIAGASMGTPGVWIRQSANVHVLGNLIGTAADGVSPLPNTGDGVAVTYQSSNNIIGGTASGQGNTIAFNGGAGVRIDGLTGPVAGNTIRGNSIHDNTGEGIETINGGNNELTPPTIVAVGPLTGTACADCSVHVYSDNADEGRIYHGATLADGSGNWTYNGAVTGPNVTATATDLGNTSEFSAPYTLPATPTPTPSPSPSPTPTPTASATPTNAASPTPTNTASPTPTHTASPTPTVTPTDHPTPTVPPCGSSRYRGDADGNGHVDINDVLATLSALEHVPPGAACAALAEVDCDGELGADDALRILNFVAGAPLAQPTGCPGVGTLT